MRYDKNGMPNPVVPTAEELAMSMEEKVYINKIDCDDDIKWEIDFKSLMNFNRVKDQLAESFPSYCEFGSMKIEDLDATWCWLLDHPDRPTIYLNTNEQLTFVIMITRQ